MSLKSIYERFLGHPDPNILADAAVLHYVTTLKSYSQAATIAKHLESQHRGVVTKKSEKIVSAVEGSSSIAVLVDTTLEFVLDGGAYLPGMDNFVVDRTVTLPITHFVLFDHDQKIAQIRLSWDQGSLLKQVEVIGTRGKNWPITDGEQQLKLITSSTGSVAASDPTTPPRGRLHGAHVERGMSPAKRHIKDPHASLDLFEPHKAEQSAYQDDKPPVAPRASAKPPPREHSELFAAGHEDHEPSPGGSPAKKYRESVVAPKGAGGRKFANSGIFSEVQDYKEPKIYKTNPARYNHFDLGESYDDPMQHKTGGEGQQAKAIPLVARSNKHGSQWDFVDFVTPAKVSQRERAQDAVHFSFDDQVKPGAEHEAPAKGAGQVKARRDNESHFELQDDGTPVEKKEFHPKPRKDAAAHFEFTDEPSPVPSTRRIIGRTKAAQGLYANNQIYDEELEGGEAPLANITNTKNASRKNDFGSHWDEPDAEPQGGKKPASGANPPRKDLDSHWAMGEENEQPASQGGRNRRPADKGIWDF